MTVRRALLVTGMLMMGGCGTSTIAPDRLADAQGTYEEATQAFSKKNHAEALALFNAALAPEGGLSGDRYADALTKRAVCLAFEGKTTEALSDLDLAAQGAADMASVHMARAFVYLREGDPTKARQQTSLAKKINPRAKPFRD